MARAWAEAAVAATDAPPQAGPSDGPGADPPGSACASSPGSLAASLLAAAMALPMGPAARAETPPERGVIAIKYLDYLDSQPGADRIAVRAPSLLISAPVAGDWSVLGTYLSDSISGASPAYHSTALTRMRDKRTAGTVSVSRYFPNGLVTVGGSLSTENDYLSRGLFFQGALSTDDRNTTWNLGLAATRDLINPSNGIVEHERKRIAELIVGITQVVTRRDIVQLTLGRSQGRGYFSDPYKALDRRPRERNHTTLMARWNHHVEATDGVTRLSYRYYTDTYAIRAHTLGAEYVQPLGRGWTVMPLIRLYTQNSARFYVDVNPDSGPFPTNPPPDATHYSLDQRLSSFGALTLGLKVAWQIDADWQVDVKFEQYRQRGQWALSGGGSPGLEPFNARSIRVGISRQF